MEKIFALVLDIILCLFSFIFMILAFCSLNKLYFDTSLIKEYRDNWSRGPILDIFISPDGKECPEGYDYFISNKFPAIVEGCSCLYTYSKDLAQKVYTGRCDADMMINGCDMIFYSPNIRLKTWRGRNLCVSRMNKTFWEMVSTVTDCPNGYKKCGLLDTFNNSLCVKNSEKCPINEIIVSPSYKRGPINYTSIKLDDWYNLYYTNQESNSKIIVEIEARNKPPCSHPYEAELGQNEYPLNTKKGSDVCSTVISGYLNDPRFEEVDSQSIKDFYNENGILKIINKLKDYKYYNSTESVSLYKINYFGWNKTCLNVEPAKLNPDQNDVEYYFQRNAFLSFTCFIHFAFVTACILIYKICIENMRVSFKIILVTDFINFVLILIIVIMSYTTKNGVKNIINPYQLFIEHNCGDNITNGVMNLAFNDISKVIPFTLIIFILSFLELVYMFLYYTWILVISKLKKE